MDNPMKWIDKVLKWPVLYLWDKYELDPPLALALFILLGVIFVLLGVILAPLGVIFVLLSLIATAIIFGYVLFVVIWAIAEEIFDDNN